MTLVRTSLLNSFAVAARIGSGLVLNKILAVFVGPAGYAVIGQFQNAISIVVGLAGGVVSTGVTKATAEHFDDEERQHAVWQTAIRFSLIASVVAAVSLLFLGGRLAQWLLHRADMSDVFIWLVITLPAMAANNLFLAIVNGKKEVGVYVAANVAGSLISVLITGLLAANYGLHGALIAYTINPAITLLATSALVARRSWFKARFLWGSMDAPATRELAGFGLMALTSALTVPITQMLIRDYLVNNLGLAAAGYWQAAWKISEIYLMLITATLSAYYLPRLAEISTAPTLKAEIIKVYRLVLPLAAAGAITIFLLRDFIISSLFTKDFSPMRELLPWQLTGDVIKIGSWILAYIMLGRAMVWTFVITEIGFSLSFCILTRVLVRMWDLPGVAIAYALNYSLYWVCMFYITRREMRWMDGKHGSFA